MNFARDALGHSIAVYEHYRIGHMGPPRSEHGSRPPGSEHGSGPPKVNMEVDPPRSEHRSGIHFVVMFSLVFVCQSVKLRGQGVPCEFCP